MVSREFLRGGKLTPVRRSFGLQLIDSGEEQQPLLHQSHPVSHPFDPILSSLVKGMKDRPG